MAKSKGRLLAELLSSDGRVIKTKSEASTIAADDLPSIPNSKLSLGVQDGQLSQNNFTNADHSKLDNMAAYATAVVASLPSSPDANTIYFVTGD
tara:strand:- start:2355 stop:2636 length:282 start_codon:yes stop_codon:yes gene_type:complete